MTTTDDLALGLELPRITDEVMRERLAQLQAYTLLLLNTAANYRIEGGGFAAINQASK